MKVENTFESGRVNFETGVQKEFAGNKEDNRISDGTKEVSNRSMQLWGRRGVWLFLAQISEGHREGRRK